MQKSPSTRIGVVTVIIQNRTAAVKTINNILTDYSDVIIGRLGLPRDNLSIITLIVEGNTDQIGAMTGKIGQIDQVSVKTAFAKTS